MSLPLRRLLAAGALAAIGYLSFVAACHGLNLLAILAGAPQ